MQGISQLGPRPAAPRYCGSCGHENASDARFCPACGAPTVTSTAAPDRDPRPAETANAFAMSALSAPSKRSRRPWPLIVGMVALGLVAVLLGGLFFTTRGSLNRTKDSLAAANSNISDLTGQVGDLNNTNDQLTSDKSSLESDNSSLKDATSSCKAAAAKAHEVLNVLFAAFNGTASLYDFSAATRAEKSAWSACQVAANGAGAF